MRTILDVIAAVLHVAWYALVGVAAILIVLEMVLHHGPICR